MAFDNTVTVVGNLTRDPEIRYTPAGSAVATFGLAWNHKDKAGDELVSFFDITCWRDLAENVAASLVKGNRVVVYGRLDYQSWEKDGQRRSKVEVVADDVAPSLRWATVEIIPNPRSDNPGRAAASRRGPAPVDEPF